MGKMTISRSVTPRLVGICNSRHIDQKELQGFMRKQNNNIFITQLWLEDKLLSEVELQKL